MRKKILISFLVLLLGFVIWNGLYSFDKEKAAFALRTNALSRSHNCCAWYVMRAMHKGGCPAIILPAFAYSVYLPLIGWEEIKEANYKPKSGDVSVFPAVKGHPYGHIAMWDGSRWISDFKQKGIIVNKAYSEYKIFRCMR